MRRYLHLGVIIPGVRGRMLAALMLRHEKWWYQSELADYLEVTASTLQRDLTTFLASGLLEDRVDGRRRYFRPNRQSPLFRDLRGLVLKTEGVPGLVREAVEPFLPMLDRAVLYGSMAKGTERATSDVDLLLVGNVSQMELLPALRKLEKQLGREVNATILSRAEFEERQARGDHFLSHVFAEKTVELMEVDGELAQVAE